MEDKNKAPWWSGGLIIFTKVSASIAIPIVIALYVGKYFDNKFNTSPYIFLGLTFVAFFTSAFSIWKNVKKYIKDLEEKEKNKLK